MSLRSVLSLATLALVSAVPLAASAEECTGWFCDDSSKTDGDPKIEPKIEPWKPGEFGTATIPSTIPGLDSDVLSGTITELVPGDHLTLKLPNGELKTLKWGELLQLQVSGKIVIGAGAPAPAHPPPPPSTVVISPPPPKYMPPPPPAPVYAPPPDESEPEHVAPRDEFKERWTLGLGLSLMSPNDRAMFTKNGTALRDVIGGGTGFEASLGYRFSPSWTTYGFYEYSRFRTVAQTSDASAHSSLAGLGLRANTNPDGPLGFFFDFGIGYRWLTLSGMPQSDASTTSDVQFSGWEYLRLGAGLSLNSSKHVRWHVALVGSAGSFSKMKSGSGCMGSQGSCEEIPEESRGSYGFGGVALGGQFDL